MTALTAASDAFLVLAVAVVVVSCVGIAAMPDAYQKLHYVTPIGMVAPSLVAFAVTFREGWSNQATCCWVTALLLAVSSPVVGHATARALRIRTTGDWRLVEPSQTAAHGGGGRS